MKIKLLYILIPLAICSELHAQGVLSNSKLETKVYTNGKLFGTTGIEFPQNSRIYSMGESVLWLSGVTSTDTFVSANLFGNEKSDFQPGPLKIDGSEGATDSKWQTVYSIDKNQIESHKYNFSKPNYNTPLAIENWPSNGDEGYTKLLAPFVDWNNNELYEPTQGDYPYIYGDQMAFTVLNDRGAHGLTSGDGMGVQVESMVSVFYDEQNASQSNVVINRLLLENRSNENYEDFKLSVLTNFVLGNPMDNYVGTNVKENYVYCYNKGNTDDEYGNKIPVLVVFPLEEKWGMSSSIYLNANNDAQTGFPKSKLEFFNYANGFWRNGKFIAYGGAGLDGVTPCKFVYSGTTDKSVQGSDWTEVKAGNSAGHRNILMNIGLANFMSDSTKQVSIAYAILEDFDGNYTKLDSFVNQVRKNNMEGRYTRLNKLQLGVSIYPTLTSPGDMIYIKGAEASHINVKLFDSKGVMVNEIRKINNNSFILNEGLMTGFYYLEVISNGMSTRTKLFIQ